MEWVFYAFVSAGAAALVVGNALNTSAASAAAIPSSAPQNAPSMPWRPPW
jgi:hypothetical protein